MKIIKNENYTHAQAFPLSIEHHADGHYTYVQSAGSRRTDIEDIKTFRQQLVATGWTFHSYDNFE